MELIIDALKETGQLMPGLAVIFLLVALIEYKYGNVMSRLLIRFKIFGPVIGAVLGCMPQCGFSVVASALYVKKIISTGTLLSIYLSTSDEAIPILLSMPEKAHMVGNVIIVKIIISVISGILIDLVLNFYSTIKNGSAVQKQTALDKIYYDHSGCCDHKLAGKHNKIKTFIFHPIRHTVKIGLFLFVLTIVLNYFIKSIGEESISYILCNGTFFQPFFAALIGLVPNCFPSVLLAKFFAKGIISFGAMISGLCSGAGLGLLVLIKENKNLKDTLFIIGLLLLISTLAGEIIQLFP